MKEQVLDPELLTELESLIRSGHFGRVEWILKRLNLKKVPRRSILPIANFARRVNLCSMALRLLNPVIRCDSHAPIDPASNLERVEYAESLRKMGAVDEAMEILKEIDSSETPAALFHGSLCLFSQWRYAEAIPLLTAYIRNPDISAYARLVGQVNLAAAYVHEAQIDSATRLLCELREATQSEYRLLHGNVLELSAQLEFANGNFARVRGYLNESAKALGEAGALEHLWVRKWRAIADSFEAGRATPALYSVCEEALRVGHWETARDVHLYIGRLNRDAALVSYVYFGTPFVQYRRSLLEAVKDWYELPDVYELTGAETPCRVLDCATALLSNGEEVMPAGQAPHRLLVLLARDFFKPLPLVAAFAQLFPEECFNPVSSPSRVHQSVKRLRTALNKAGTGIEVQETNGAYKLVVGGATAVRVRRKPISLNARELQLNVLKEKLGTEPFSVRQAVQALGSSVSTAQRLLRWAVESHHLGVRGAGSRTRYYLELAPNSVLNRQL